MPATIDELVGRAAKLWPDKLALICEDRSFTFSEIDGLADALARGLHARGVRPGDRVSLYSPNRWEWVVSYYAIFKLGAVANPLNMMLTPGEALFAVGNCESGCVITTGDRAALLVEQAQGPGLLVISFDDAGASGSSVQFSDLLDAQAPAFEAHSRQSSDLATVCYTSGTTGHPKGAMQTHQSIVLNTELTSTLHGRNPHDVAVSALPCSHVYGNVVMNSAFLCGMTLVLHGSFDVERVMESIQKNRATLFEGVPTMYMYMLNFARASAYDMSSLQRCTVGGQTMPVSSMARVEKLLGCPLLELWGMTELAGLGTTFPLYGPRRPGSIGLPLPLLQARVVDADNPGRPLKPGEVGELRMKGPVVMSGYYGNDAGTRDSFDDEGWLRTGDLARIDAEGFIYVVDRLKDMIITGGYNIYPAEIERVLSGHPGVAMVAVGRISDEMKGELAKAYVVRSLAGEATEEDLLLYCREHLAAYKVPRVIAFVAELPKTSTGKVLRRMLHTLDIKPSDKQGA